MIFYEKSYRSESSGRILDKKNGATDNRPHHFFDSKAELDLNLNLYAAGKFELHQGIDSLGSRAVDVNEALVV